MARFGDLLLSACLWVLVGALTALLFLFGLFVLGPPSLIFERQSGRLLHGVSQIWASVITVLTPFWEIQAEGLERIERNKPYVVVSNHQSALDILVLAARLPLHFKFIAKQELFWIPFLGWHLTLARYLCLKRGDPESGRACLKKAREWLRRGVSVIFFPEGTRSPDGKIHDFKAGAFKVALEEGIDLLPVVITGTRSAIPKYSWRIHERSSLGLIVLEPVSVRGLSIADLDELRSRIRTRIVEEFERRRPAA